MKKGRDGPWFRELLDSADAKLNIKEGIRPGQGCDRRPMKSWPLAKMISTN